MSVVQDAWIPFIIKQLGKNIFIPLPPPPILMNGTHGVPPGAGYTLDHSKAHRLLEVKQSHVPYETTKTIQVRSLSHHTESDVSNQLPSTFDILGGREKKKRLYCTSSSFSEDGTNESPRDNTKRQKFSEHSTGEHRLTIHFESFGKFGKVPQSFGRKGSLIPDGICGTHTLYHQDWRFEILHGPVIEGETCLIWRVTNLSSRKMSELTETSLEAQMRRERGWTISSKVFREALKSRLSDLENELKKETNQTKKANLESLLKALKPSRFTEGLLAFGLLHESVQNRMRQELEAQQINPPSV